MLFCAIESKVKGWKTAGLRAKKKLRGLPSVLFLGADGEPLIYVPFQGRSVETIRTTGQRAARYVALRRHAATGNAIARAHYLRMQLEENKVSLAEATKLRPKKGEDAKLEAALDELMLHLSIAEQVRAKGQKGRHELGPKFYAMLTKGPKPGPTVSRGFWYALLEWAEREQKADEFATSLDAFRRALAITDPDAAWVPNLLRRYEDKLARIRRE